MAPGAGKPAPSKPKRVNAFILFRTEKSKQFKGTPQTQVSKIIGEMWTKLSDAEKNRWRIRARNGEELSSDDNDDNDLAERENKRPKNDRTIAALKKPGTSKVVPAPPVTRSKAAQKPKAVVDKGKKTVTAAQKSEIAKKVAEKVVEKNAKAVSEESIVGPSAMPAPVVETPKDVEKSAEQAAETDAKTSEVPAIVVVGPSDTMQDASVIQASITEEASVAVPPVEDEPNYSAFVAGIPPVSPPANKSFDLTEKTLDEPQDDPTGKAADEPEDNLKTTIEIPPIPGIVGLTIPGPYQIIAIHKIDNPPYRVAGLTTRTL
ncbi:hypothetical protein CC1G_07876 [Coprinopsis cinerea okayama7|uniref:HMG box domain-containing protein n=1 Tax=Coprinopsis cinerea (strain Okayama-7 / 130 / ATCC MYA-4618 / FGSC 9003) TaxID=240176 RepID=A8P456_COPC7|nr:hypothetical protein CC1G_07876 [Coprinopsis cinerea okayama7\|eukprot:XP_001838685.2 hypothetical protein CC1G_07876 [Coprinopsis cinerea okayama7\